MKCCKSGLREQAFLNAGVHIQLTDERPAGDRPESERDREIPYQNSYCYEGGISSFVEHINASKDVLHPDVIHFSAVAEDENSTAEVALQYTDTYQEQIFSFANNIRTTDGGTHEDGFKRALTRCDERLCPQVQHPQGERQETLRRGRAGGLDLRHQRQAEGGPVRGPDQGEAGQYRDELSGQLPCSTST